MNHLLELQRKFTEESKVWLYLAPRKLLASETQTLSERLRFFCSSWQSHGKPVKGDFIILYDCLLLLVADTESQNVSGCSIDSSLKVIQELNQLMGFDWTYRLRVALIQNEAAEIMELSAFEKACSENKITAESRVIDTTCATLKDCRNHLIAEVQQTWLKRYLTAF